MNLNGKVAFVTGGGSGIGKASAIRFAQAGAKVVVLARTKEDLDATVDEIRKAGGEAIAIAGDVAKEADLTSAVAKVIEAFGRLDVVVADAAVRRIDDPAERRQAGTSQQVAELC